MSVTYEVMVDWDMTDWSATPDFSDAYDDISNDVQSIDTSRGKEAEDGNAPAATLTIRMKPGLVSKYSPFNTTGPLYGLLLPWRVIRVKATNDGGGTYWPLFFGYISKYTIVPHLSIQSVTLYCTDGTDLLARQTASQDYDAREDMTEGDAMGDILDTAGWSSTRRSLSAGTLLKYPLTNEI